MKEFLAMGGYAAFLWPAYAVTVIALLANVFSARRDLRAARDEAARRLRESEADGHDSAAGAS